ncbi:MAG: MFS transporter [Stackebrandtia sp.]
METQKDRWWLVIAAGVIYVMVQLDALSVVIALPTIQSELDIGPGVSQWTLLGYTLPAVALGMSAGRYLDRIGLRTALLLAVPGFALAAFAAGLATSIEWLIAARVAQGVFGSLVFVLMPVLASTAVRPQLRGRAMGLMFAIGPLGGMAGTAAVGVMIDHWGWSSIFYPHIPLAAVVLAIGLSQLPRSAAASRPDRSMIAESGLLTVAVLAAMLGLSLAADGRFAWLALALLALPPVLIWRRMESGRMVWNLLRIPGVRAPLLALWAQTLGQLTVQFLVPFYVRDHLNAESAQAGLILLTLPAGMVLLSPIAGWLVDSWGDRRTAMLGLAVTLMAIGSLVWLGNSWTIVDLAWRLGLLGIGVGVFTGAQTAMAMAAAPPELIGSVSAALSFARQVGIGTAPALATILWGLTGYGLAGMRLAILTAGVLGLVGLYALWRAGSRKPGDDSGTGPLRVHGDHTSSDPVHVNATGQMRQAK